MAASTDVHGLTPRPSGARRRARLCARWRPWPSSSSRRRRADRRRDHRAAPTSRRCLEQIKAGRHGSARRLGGGRPVPARDGRPSSGAKRALEIGGANGYSAIWIGLGLRETGGRLVDDRVRPGARQRGRRQHPPRRPVRHRHGRPGRRVQGDPEARAARSTSCSSTRGSATTSGSSTSCFPRLDAARPVPRAQRRQQAERDARLPRRRSRTTRRCSRAIVTPSGEGMSVSGERADRN